MTDSTPGPRTVSGRAAVSSLRPHVRRAITATIVAIEDEARAPLVELLRDTHELIRRLVADRPSDPRLAGEAADLQRRLAEID
jgi:hypothetical protein